MKRLDTLDFPWAGGTVGEYHPATYESQHLVVDEHGIIDKQATDKQVVNQTVVDKQKVAAAFSQAAPCYDSAAKLQQQVLEQLVQELPALPDHSVVVDLGCGTGKGLQQLTQRYPMGQLFGLDLAYGMLVHARSSQNVTANWCCGDAEQLPLQENSIDLVFSSLAIQWCQSFPKLLSQIQQALKPGGYFVLSTLTEGTLAELSQAWQQIDRYAHVNKYPSENWHRQQINGSGFQIVQAKNKQEVAYEQNLKAILQGLKNIGAGTVNGKRRSGLMSRQQYRQLTNQYEAFRQPSGLPATYQVFYSILKKPND
ncbi:malonyl-ACP O-methyltransferase BioC [Endozoicomonas sp. SM1973]|uniref:Malonyl-[acyl-carrier protein] O-methyltransferase n=1 Tax=Spartinivicinus marinus TaxID=2994442 RepID=A0A853I9D8_9GAMM|nr:malonyl-ACP O-methyltransferase BioC [Spartinivicinus marinus]MCX4026377.1 malonyl-ACP O-methyltransferase BioC [Spartinivicinus marinus]NYZ67278.1 malonyl-ACP O-methyltransferase BioC [Spartinivicinus marinus]